MVPMKGERSKHDERLDKRRIELASFISFLMGFSQSVLAYVMSSYFKLASGTENVGAFYTVAYIIVLIALLNLHKLVRGIGKSNVFYVSLIIKLSAIAALIFAAPSRLGIFLLMIFVIAGNMEWVSLDVIIESFSTDKMSGRIRGLHLTVLNAGFLLGPFISTHILDQFNFQGIFIFAFIFNAFVLIFSLIGFRNVNHRFDQDLKVLDVIKKVVAQKNILRIYYISFVLEFFYALMIIYTPLYLLDLGFTWDKIGLIFTFMLIPFVLLQYPMGFLADKKTGEKEFLIFSIFIMGVSTLFIYFIGAAGIVFWSVALFATRIGAALIEILRDSYFYKKIDGHDVDMINFFRTSLPVAYIVATAMSSFILFIFPIKVAFILAGVVVLSALYPAVKLADSKSEREMIAEKRMEAAEA